MFPLTRFILPYLMSLPVPQVQAVRDRRDQMMLSMAKDASRTKTKAREARHKGTRQVGYRAVRYQRFQGRRGEVMEEEARKCIRARRARSIQLMATWLEAQALTNAEEGTQGGALSRDGRGLRAGRTETYHGVLVIGRRHRESPCKIKLWKEQTRV